MSEPASAASAAPAASAPVAAAPAPASAPAAPAADANAAAAGAQAAAATPDAQAPAPDVQALTDARTYLKDVLGDEKALEGKTDVELLALASGAKAQAAKFGTAPENYETFTAPEGMTLDAGVVSEFAGTAKELGLSQEKAQTLINKLSPVIAQRQAAHVTETLTKADTEWQAAAKADPEIGGDKFDENVAIAQRAMTLATPAMKQLLNDSRLGNHPEVMRWMFRVGSQMSPDGKHFTGQPVGSQGEKSLEDRMWPAKS